MDITLATNTENPTFKFQNITRFQDGSGYGAEVFVRSRGFSMELPFNFETQPLDRFIANLESMNQSLEGNAILKPIYEDQFIELKMGSTGHVIVRGQFTEFTEMPQSLNFAFQTDQSCLAPFIRELRQWRKLNVV